VLDRIRGLIGMRGSAISGPTTFCLLAMPTSAKYKRFLCFIEICFFFYSAVSVTAFMFFLSIFCKNLLGDFCKLYSRGSRFLIYNFLQCPIDGKNNSKTKIEKVFFFVFMSSYAEISFFKSKITK
jgi:hypothetical protein